VNDRQRIQLVKALASRTELLGVALDTVVEGTTVIARMRELQGNLRARTYEAGPASVRHDAVFAGLRPDQAAADERDLDRALKAASTEIAKAWAIIGRYPVPARVSERQRRDLGLVADPGCESCARTKGPAGGNRWVAPHPNLRRPTTVGGRLPAPIILCRWCYECVRNWGRLPLPAEIDLYHQVGRVPWPDDVKAPR
jgi:hypothetical protein